MVKSVRIDAEIKNPQGLEVSGDVVFSLRDEHGETLAKVPGRIADGRASAEISGLEGLSLWQPDAPALYTIIAELLAGDHQHRAETRFGFRTAEFREEGFYLNGEPLHLRGLNRHQSFPYVGYAMGKRAQERDAEILKHDLKCNLVRTSHYPQSKWFHRSLRQDRASGAGGNSRLAAYRR